MSHRQFHFLKKISLKDVPLLLQKLHLKLKKDLPTTLNNIIATASLTIPYPKITEKSLGCYEGLIRVNAATESVAQIVALNLIIRVVVRMMAPL